jgi:hypothetical protein
MKTAPVGGVTELNEGDVYNWENIDGQRSWAPCPW